MTGEPKLLHDEMLSGDIAAQLRGKGHDVTAVVEDSALVGTPDEELLGLATSEGRLLVTANVRDFAAIHASWSSRGRSHAGLIYLVNRVFPSDRSFLGAIVTALDDMIVAGQLPAAGMETYLHPAQTADRGTAGLEAIRPSDASSGVTSHVPDPAGKCAPGITARSSISCRQGRTRDQEDSNDDQRNTHREDAAAQPRQPVRPRAQGAGTGRR